MSARGCSHSAYVLDTTVRCHGCGWPLSAPQATHSAAVRILLGHAEGEPWAVVPAVPKYAVGDPVTLTNDYGAIFPGKTITGVETSPRGAPRYYLSPTDTPWYSVAERNLCARFLI